MRIKERDSETGAIKENFTEIAGSLPNPQERITQLEAEKASLQQKLAQLNGDFAAFTDFYFEKNPTQA